MAPADGIVIDDHKSPIPTNLVLGSEGFLGRVLCRYLEQREKVIHCDIKLNAFDLRHDRLDLTGVDRVYLLAWDVGGAKYLYDPATQEAQFEWNMKLMANTLPQLKGIPFLFVSSQQAGNRTAYGISKAVGEAWSQLLGGVVVRLWNLYGEMEDTQPERSHVISDFVRQAKETGRIYMQTNGTEYRQFTHVFDACRALHLAIIQQYRRVFDATSGEWVAIKQIANFVAAETGAEIIPGNEKGHIDNTAYVGRMPGWSADIKLEDGIRAMING